jgi:hypothetical protein
MRTTVSEPNGSVVLNPIQAEGLRNLVHKLETINFSGIQKDLGQYGEETNAVDVQICGTKCIGRADA